MTHPILLYAICNAALVIYLVLIWASLWARHRAAQMPTYIDPNYRSRVTRSLGMTAQKWM